MPSADRSAFAAIYREELGFVLDHWSRDMQQGLARHNRGWAEGKLDFGEYLSRSIERYWRAFRSVRSVEGVASVCDVGGFWGLLPLVLKRLGYDVSMTEALEYYGPAFDGLFTALERRGIRVIDYDPFGSKSLEEQFDFLTIMAVLEHYPHSLRDFMSHARSMLRPRGGAYVEVPNIAYWYKRLNLLMHGLSPLPSVDVIWNSDVPFTGHHHEFTLAELRDLAVLSGFDTISIEAFNYSIGMPSIRSMIRHPILHGLARVVLRMRPATREVLGATWRLRS